MYFFVVVPVENYTDIIFQCLSLSTTTKKKHISEDSLSSSLLYGVVCMFACVCIHPCRIFNIFLKAPKMLHPWQRACFILTYLEFSAIFKSARL